MGDHRSENYEQIVQSLVSRHREIGANMSIKLHFLHNHLDRFPENMGSLIDEQGERFHQDIKDMETRYQGRWDEAIVADNFWSFDRDEPAASHARASRKQVFHP